MRRLTASLRALATAAIRLPAAAMAVRSSDVHRDDCPTVTVVRYVPAFSMWLPQMFGYVPR